MQRVVCILYPAQQFFVRAQAQALQVDAGAAEGAERQVGAHHTGKAFGQVLARL